MYGTPFSTVPEFFTGWVSWFTGDATDMFPSPPAAKAARMVELTGGVEAVVAAAKADHDAGEYQLAAELAQLALRADPATRMRACSRRLPCGHVATRSSTRSRDPGT